MGEADIRELLQREDAEYRNLAAQHRDFEDRLGELSRRSHLNSQEQIERTNLKKYKLQVKDRMQELIRQRRS